MSEQQVGAVRAPDGSNVRCWRCDKAERVLMFWKLNTRGARRSAFSLCAECIAEGLDIATGYPVANQLQRWTEFSAHSSELQQQSVRSRKAIKKQQERDAARAKLQAREL